MWTWPRQHLSVTPFASEDQVKRRLTSIALTDPLEDTTALQKSKSSFLSVCVALKSKQFLLNNLDWVQWGFRHCFTGLLKAVPRFVEENNKNLVSNYGSKIIWGYKRVKTCRDQEGESEKTIIPRNSIRIPLNGRCCVSGLNIRVWDHCKFPKMNEDFRRSGILHVW